MPSTLLTRASGFPFILYSGNVFSGQGIVPIGGIQLHLDRTASGNAYISYSGGGNTVTSGYIGALSGGTTSLTDMYAIPPGGSFFVPKIELLSGILNIYATCDAAASGQARLYWQPL